MSPPKREMCARVILYCCIYLSLLAVYGMDTDMEARLRLYYTSVDHYEELPLSAAEQLFSLSWYNESRTTVVYVHGYTGGPDGKAVRAVTSAYLQHTDSNVALLNWQQLAAGSRPGLLQGYTAWAVPNAIQLGIDFADVLWSLAARGLRLDRTHLVGHSLGAHLFGVAGNHLALRGVRLPRIIGLDPSGPAFDSRPGRHRLTRGSADCVAVVHTDPSRYGSSGALGTLDFWPNYRPARALQPGCDNRPNKVFSEEDLCNHNRSWKLLVDALSDPGGLVGAYAKNFREWKRGKWDGELVQEIGTCDPYARPGSYFLVTRAQAPYGLGSAGLNLLPSRTKLTNLTNGTKH